MNNLAATPELVLELTDCVYDLLCVVSELVDQNTSEHGKLCMIEDRLVSIKSSLRGGENDKR